ncbi:cysteine-rich venom protein helothermine isoform X1 [Pogona vitticeps]
MSLEESHIISKGYSPKAMAMFSPCVGLVALLLLHPSIQASDLDPYMTTNANQQQEIVDKHNSLRRAVQPPASDMLKMEWNSEAASHAQSWVNQCLLKSSPPESRKLNGVVCGENIFMSSIILSWSQVIQKWYDEGKTFEYGSAATSTNTKIRVYTQVVWYNSYQVGCAVAFCPGQPVFKYFYACQYCPAGNREDKISTPYTKGEPCGACPDACDNGLCTNPCKYKDVYTNCPEMKKLYGCDIPLMKQCPASCKCTTEIK